MLPFGSNDLPFEGTIGSKTILIIQRVVATTICIASSEIYCWAEATHDAHSISSIGSVYFETLNARAHLKRLIILRWAAIVE
jgi:hypothetical protein